MNKCLYCGKPTKNNVFCSIKCSKAYQSKVNYEPNEIDKILRIVAKLTDGQLQYGMLTDIAIEVGKSRERVRQRAKMLGLLPSRKLSKEIKINCWYCGKPFKPTSGKVKYCSYRCKKEYALYKYWQLKICKNCGLGFITMRKMNGSHNPHQQYCSKKCYGSWWGRHFGGGRANK